MENKKSTFRAVLETGLCLFAGAGIGVMMKSAGKMLTPDDAKKITKLACKAGELALSSALVRVASKEISTTFDEVKELSDMVNININIPEEQNNETNEEEPENVEE